VLTDTGGNNLGFETTPGFKLINEFETSRRNDLDSVADLNITV